MALIRPTNIDINGDESVLSRRWEQPSLLGSQRGTDKTKRIETDADGNLLVNVAAGSTGGLTDVELRASPVPVVEKRSASAVVTAVSASTSTVTLLTLNASRIGFRVYNTSTGRLFLKLGSAASTSSFTVLMSSGAYYEDSEYTGIVTAVWSNTNGDAKITELS